MKSIILKPIVSEKSVELGKLNKYVFMVNPDADKRSVAAAIKESFAVEPIKINLISVKGKAKRFRGRLGKRKDFAKAIVTLAKGKEIKLFKEAGK